MLNFESDLRSIVLSHLPVPGASGQAALAAAPTNALLIKFLNWRNRLVHPHPRRVFKSREMMANPLYTANRASVGLLLGKIAVGLDVDAHLSKGILVGYQAGARRRADLDLLLNDWGIHHLHLSHVPWPDGFNARTGDLLFVIFRPREAYVLDVMPHGLWAEEVLVRNAVRNWPRAGLFLEINGVQGHGPSGPPNRTTLRNKGMNAFVEVDGRIWMPSTGGIVAAQTSFQVTRLADWLLDRLRSYGDNRSALLHDMQASPDNIGLRLPRKPVFRLVIASSQDCYGFAIQEQSSGATLWVGG